MRVEGKFRCTDDLDVGGHHLLDWRYLGDIPAGGATDGQVLTWNGQAWAPEDAPSGGGTGMDVHWDDILDVPMTFPPEAHTHLLTAITQSGASLGQVPTWDGSQWVPATPVAGSGAVTSIIAGTGISVSTSVGDVTVTCDLTWSELANKPATFPPSAHTHSLSAITQSGATTGQVPTWNATTAAWEPEDPATGGGGVTSIVAGTGINVSTSVGVVTVTCDLTWSELANKPATFPPSTHGHSLADLTQSGATSGQVVVWNNTATEWQPQTLAISGVPTYIMKTSDETRNSTTHGSTPAIDGELQAVLLAGAMYTIELFLIMQGSTLRDFKAGIGISNLAYAFIAWTNHWANAQNVLQLGATATVDYACSGAGATRLLARQYGLVRVTATTNVTVGAYWSNSTAGLGACTLYTNSYLSVTRLV